MNEELCPCSSEKNFDDCCGPILDGKSQAKTAEELMRSRYSAFAVQDIDYIFNTTAPETREELDRDEIEAWSEQADWNGLSIVETNQGQADDTVGQVEFVAHYYLGRKEQRHHELSEFKKVDGKWFFVDGKMINTTFQRASAKIGRNDPCHCGSGKKFKKCCG